MVEKREFPREGVDIDAVFNFGEGEGSLCKIEDFSGEGIYVTISDHRYLKVVKDGLTDLESVVTVTFKANSRYVALDCVVVHQQDIGLGLKFVHPNPKNIEAIRLAAASVAKQKSHATHISKEQGNKTLAAAKKSNLIKVANSRARSFLDERIPEFLKVLDDVLLIEAEIQSNDAAQHQYFDAIAGFKKLSRRLLDQIDGIISADASDVANNRWKEKNSDKSTEDTDGSLSLVEKDEFEDWLIVRVATSRTELQFRDILIELQLRLDVAFGQEGGARIYNPYGPAAYCHAFYESIRPLRLSHKVERLVFKIFQERILGDLGSLYKGLNKILIDADVLPDINVAKYLASQALKNRTKSDVAKADEKTLAPNPDADGDTLLSEAMTGLPGGAVPPNNPSSFAQLQAGLARARSAYSTASKLWQLHSNQSSPADVRGGVSGDPQGELPANVANEYAQAIQSVRSQVLEGAVNLDAPGALKHYIAQATAPDSPLADQHLESADMIENLFSNIVESSRIEHSLRSDLRKLEVPLLEVLLSDPTLFTADFHPARQAVNYIALLSDRGSVNLNQNKPLIRESINELVEKGNSDPDSLSKVVEKLDVLVEKEKKLIERNLTRVTEACAGQEKVRSANAMVERELVKRLGEQPVPDVLLTLVDNGWRDLMRLCYFREGLGSRAWEMTLIVIDQILLRLIPGAYDESKILFKSDELTKLIQKGISKVEKNATRSEQIVGEIDSLLHKGVSAATSHSVYKTPQGAIDSPAERLEKLGVTDDDKSIQRWMKRAKSLKEGQWLEFETNSDSSVLNQLAWISEQYDRYVFVNHHGMKVKDMSLEELALKLKSGDILVLSDSSMPAVEKGLDALIQKIYDQLAFESAHDQLTGLKTRKEFERCIAQSVARSKKNDAY